MIWHDYAMSHDDSVRAKALQLSRSGMPQHEIADRLGVARSTVCRWLRKAPDLGAELEPVPRSEPPPPIVEAPVAATPGTPEEIMRGVVAQLQRGIAEAQATGNTPAATRLSVELAKLTNNLARVAEQNGEDGDVIKMSRADIEAGLREVDEQIAILASVPHTCAMCGRKMRIRAASNGAASE